MTAGSTPNRLNSRHVCIKKLQGEIKTLQKQIKILRNEKANFDRNCHYAPGHYFSTIICVNDIKKRAADIWGPENIDGVAGIKLHVERQLELLKDLSQYYDELPFPECKEENFRYYYQNVWYTYSDAILLYSMVRHLKPKKIIEIGSGHSSGLMLDTNDLFLGGRIDFTFIEPNPERLFLMLKESDKRSVTIIPQQVQFVPPQVFEALDPGDILFIDSSHVVKTASDVNFILFEVLPRLKKGVYIHFHDIFYAFEYPKKWIFDGWNWNEIYFLKAFLMYNDVFEIKLFSHYLHKHHKEAFAKMPLCYHKRINGCLWLEKK